MNPESTNLLEQLRDIHAAEAVPLWPPAPGWWVLAALLLLLLVVALRYALRRYRERARRRSILGYVEGLTDQIDPVAQPQQYLLSINRVLKLVAMRAFPERQCAAMQGAAWAGFLAETSRDDRTASSMSILANGPYQPAAKYDHGELKTATLQWISQHG